MGVQLRIHQSGLHDDGIILDKPLDWVGHLLHHQTRSASHSIVVISNLHVNSFKETRQSKQLRPKTTPFFLERKNELPRAGLEPATSCVLGRHSTS